MDRKNFKIIFFGTPEFAAKSLQALFDDGYNIVGAVTQPDRPTGRKQEIQKSAVKKFAEKKELRVIEQSEIAGLSADVGILFAYGEILKRSVFDLFPLGILNIHPSLLPKYRGASPVQSAILAGDKITGVTIIRLDEKMDHGPIVAQEKVEIKEGEMADKLHERLAGIGTDLLLKILPDYIAGKIKLRQQNHEAASFCPRFRREDGLIDWRRPACEILRQFRAFHPWPGVFTLWQGKRLKIVKLSEIQGGLGQNLAPGMVFRGEQGEMGVVCGNGAAALEVVHLEGKKEMTGRDFLNGYGEVLGKVLG